MDHKDGFCRGKDASVYVAALSNRARLTASFHRLTIKKTDCSLLILRSLSSLKAMIYISNSTRDRVYWLHPSAVCR